MKQAPVYLDYAAATPLDGSVRDAMEPFLSEHYHNPSALYAAGVNTRQALDAARSQVARVVGARPSEIIFTAGATEANNMAIHGIMRRNPKANVVVSAAEHVSVLQPAKKYTHTLVPVDAKGVVSVPQLQAHVNDQTVLVSVMYANNEVGSIQPLREIAAILDDIRAQRRTAGNTLPLYLHTDAAQAANYLDLHVARLGIDLMSINGGKIYGPKQTGALFVRAGIVLEPLLDGGGQEFGLRSGTENVAGFVGLATALEAAQSQRKEESDRLRGLQDIFHAEVAKRLSDFQMHGPSKRRLPNNLHYSFFGVDNERLIMRLDLLGVQAAAGSACSASSGKPSHVLTAMGISDVQAQSSIRFSMGRQTTEKDVLHAVAALESAVKAERR